MFLPSDRYKQFLNICDNFYNYSYENAMFIFSQNANATKIATSKVWAREYKRTLIQNAQSMEIIVPTYNESIFELKKAPVYDISQTQGNEIPTWSYDYKKLLSCVRESYSTLFSSETQSDTSIYTIILEENETYENILKNIFKSFKHFELGYVFCHHFGLDTSDYNFQDVNLDYTQLKNLFDNISEKLYLFDCEYHEILNVYNYSSFTFEDKMIINYCLEESTSDEFVEKLNKIKNNINDEYFIQLINHLIFRILHVSDDEYKKIKEDKFKYKISAFYNYTI